MQIPVITITNRAQADIMESRDCNVRCRHISVTRTDSLSLFLFICVCVCVCTSTIFQIHGAKEIIEFNHSGRGAKTGSRWSWFEVWKGCCIFFSLWASVKCTYCTINCLMRQCSFEFEVLGCPRYCDERILVNVWRDRGRRELNVKSRKFFTFSKCYFSCAEVFYENSRNI